MNLVCIRLGLGVLALAFTPWAWTADLAVLRVAGIPNFYQVNDHVFRSGQPSDGSWESIAKLGVKQVIDLRLPDEHSTTQEERAVTATGMRYVNVPMRGVVAPPPETVAKVLALLDSSDKVLVHCKRGADRTGAVVACYRIAHDRWQHQRALKEAKSLGMRWTQMGLKSFIMSFQPGNVSASTLTAPTE